MSKTGRAAMTNRTETIEEKIKKIISKHKKQIAKHNAEITKLEVYLKFTDERYRNIMGVSDAAWNEIQKLITEMD